MDGRFWFFAGCAIFLTGIASAHMDPVGDVHPVVLVQSEHFAVYFRNNDQGDGFREETDPLFRMLYSADGRLIAPRHRVKRYPDVVPAISMQRFHDKQPGAVLSLPGGKKRIQALAWPKDTEVSMLESTCLSSTHIAAALKLAGNRGDFFVYLFPREGFAEPELFLIGVPSTIYEFPTASNLVFANGKFWIAWVRGGEMVLSSMKPGDKKPTERVLDIPADWNASLSLAAIGDQLCLAYHCSLNHAYPGTGTILVKFFEAE